MKDAYQRRAAAACAARAEARVAKASERAGDRVRR